MPRGRTTLVVDPNLVSPLKLVAAEGSKILEEHRVASIMGLASADVSAATENVLYLTRPTLQHVKLIASQIKRMQRAPHVPSIHLYFVPRRTFVCDEALKEEGVFADLTTISEFGLDMVALDDDVLSLCMDTSFADVGVNGDSTVLFLLAQALVKLQKTFGHIPRMHVKGELSRQVVQMLAVARKTVDSSSIGNRTTPAPESEQPGGSRGAAGAPGSATVDQAFVDPAGGVVSLTVHDLEGDGGKSEIDVAVILDRSVDLVTPLVTPLTCEALVDEFIGVDCSMATVDYDVVYDDEPPPTGVAPKSATAAAIPAIASANRKVVVHLNSNDKLYSEIRDLNVEVMGSKIAARAKELQALEASVKRPDMKAADLKNFVRSIPGLQKDKKSLRICLNLYETIETRFADPSFIKQWELERGALDEDGTKRLLEHVSTLIEQQAPKELVLRLLCLQCAIEGGMKQKTLDGVRRELLQAYGFNELALPLFQLERCGLLWSRESGLLLGGGTARSWATLRSTFSLMASDVGREDPADIHFVTGGYAPLSVRLVQAAVAAGGRFSAAPSSVSTVTGSPWEYGDVGAAVRSLPGPTLLVLQSLRADLRARRAEAAVAAGNTGAAAVAASGSVPRKVVLIVYIGGVTHIELSSLRFLSDRLPYEFLVLTTGVVNGNELVSSAIATPLTVTVSSSSRDDASEDRTVAQRSAGVGGARETPASSAVLAPSPARPGQAAPPGAGPRSGGAASTSGSSSESRSSAPQARANANTSGFSIGNPFGSAGSGSSGNPFK